MMAKRGKKYVSEIQTIRVRKYALQGEQPAPQDVRVRSSQRTVKSEPKKPSFWSRKKKPPEDAFVEVLEETHK